MTAPAATAPRSLADVLSAVLGFEDRFVGFPILRLVAFPGNVLENHFVGHGQLLFFVAVDVFD
jgi:hypothetical protein